MVLLLYKFSIFSFFLIILENIWQRTAAAEIDQNNSDGEKFIEKLVNGEKTVFERPEYLLFTAPYKICEGGCSNNEGNFAMEFPLYIGKKGLAKYTDFYRRDHQKIHSGRPNAPLKKRSTKKLFTLCPTSMCTTTTSTEKTEPSTEEDNLTPTRQETDTATEDSSSTTNGSTSDGKEDHITESDHDTEPEIETSTQTGSPTNAELTIEMSQNDTQLEDFIDNGEKNLYSSSKNMQTEGEFERTSDYNDIQENTHTGEDAEITGDLKHGDEPINSNKNKQIEENTVTSEGIHENLSIHLKKNTQIEENMKFSGETQHGSEYIKNDEITEMTEDTQNGVDTINSKENIQTTESTEVLGEIENTDESTNVHNIKALNVHHNDFLYNHAKLSNPHKLKYKIHKTTDGDAYKKILLFRPMLTSITNAMGKICPFYVCSKKVKPDTDKLEVATIARDQFYRDVNDIDEKIDKKYSFARRGWQNEIEDNSKFEHQRNITAENTKVHLNQREDQINELEEFPPYSDDNDRNKNSKNSRVQSNAEDEFESYSDDTYEDKSSN